MSTQAERLDRCERANELVRVIGTHGRRFFWSEKYQRFGRFEVDDRGRVWWHDEYTSARVYCHVQWLGRGFHNGGTLNDLVRAMAAWVHRGERVPWWMFGPYRRWVCGDGDRWGYGHANMEPIREAAARLGVIDPPDREQVMYALACEYDWGGLDLEPVEELGGEG